MGMNTSGDQLNKQEHYLNKRMSKHGFVCYHGNFDMALAMLGLSQVEPFSVNTHMVTI